MQYLNQRIEQKTVQALRKFEKRKKLKPSITKTIKYLLEIASKETNVETSNEL